ncbi:hypothetical protein [Spiroplasma endosymbiont of Labia minor]|uniref:hypothetical protein n=1 Tax=Spiroplasma endosymbiont of Labia minor TaxID=3066305 RepID=UPI0030CAE0CD
MWSDLSKAQKFTILALLLVSLLIFTIGAALFFVVKPQLVGIILMIIGAVGALSGTIVWIIFKNFFKNNKKGDAEKWD